MDSEEPTTAPIGGGGGFEEIVVGTGERACFSLGPATVSSTPSRRTLRRKMDAREAGVRSPSRSLVPAVNELATGVGVARVEIGNEAVALREALVSHQQTIQKLQRELEEERSAAASAATEAMSMILRLQHDKAEAQMEVRQFKRLTEEKQSHDQQEIATLEDLLFKREQAVQALSCEVQAYRHRLLSFGIDNDGDAPPSEPHTPDTARSGLTTRQFDFPQEYPPLRCTTDAAPELDKYPPGETPRDHLQKLEQRIFQLERMPSNRFSNVSEKGIVAGQSPRGRTRHLRNISYGSYGTGEEFPAVMDRISNYDERDDMMSDRVCTVDAVHGASEDYVSTPRELQNRRFVVDGVEDASIRKLSLRLQALEADRESMRQTLISMGAEKCQMVLLKEIAQQMFKEASPDRKIIKKPTSPKVFSIMFVIKTAISLVFAWKKKSTRAKYNFGLSPSNSGLLLLLDKYPRTRHRRLLMRTQG
ncbi:hypothetical protein Cni_G07903 [Canna indica]|uniref:GTD-binding domain-containing protein n=1 Tax=Canna indica TaxID=4628 RepID=A0AAQ3K2X3_9LILI|nr:hypothetical protein Cni_G07903 [Canna indica]